MSNFRFHIHAPFAATVARDNIKDIAENTALITCIAELAVSSLHDIKAIGEITRNSNALLVVDAISGLLAEDLQADAWGVDVVVSGSQKGLMLPPGLSFISVNDRAWKLVESSTSARTYFDLRRYRKAMADHDTPFTPAISLVVALEEALQLVSEKGAPQILKRTEIFAEAARAGIQAIGLELFARNPGNGLTAVKIPQGIIGKELMKRMYEEYRVVVAGGQGELAGKIIRIAHMGDILNRPEDFLIGLHSLERVLTELGYSVPPGVGVRAAQDVFARAGIHVQLPYYLRKDLPSEALDRAERYVRRPVLGGNWKDKMDSDEDASALLRAIGSQLTGKETIEIFIAPSPSQFRTIGRVTRLLEGRGEIPVGHLLLGAQDVSAKDPREKGAFTGASATIRQLLRYGVTYVVVGHSERRHGEEQGVRESSQVVNAKVKLLLAHGLKPVVAVGETFDEKENKETFKVIEDQIRESLAGLTPEQMKDVVIAYEPVWAIGEKAKRAATREEANEVQRFIRGLLIDMFDEKVGSETRIQYGGSVNPTNVTDFIAMPNVDGALIGGASLEAVKFVAIAKAVNDFARDGGTRAEGSLRTMAEGTIAALQANPAIGEKDFYARFKRLVHPDVLLEDFRDPLVLALLREIFILADEADNSVQSPMMAENDLYLPGISRALLRLRKIFSTQGPIRIVLSSSELLDERIITNPAALQTILEATQGILFFTEPSDIDYAEISEAYSGMLKPSDERFISDLADLPPGKAVIFLLNEEDRDLLDLHDKFLVPILMKGNIGTAFVVPLMDRRGDEFHFAQTDFTEKIYLATLLASQISSLKDLRTLNNIVKLLLVGVTQSDALARMRFSQKDMSRAKAEALVILQGM